MTSSPRVSGAGSGMVPDPVRRKRYLHAREAVLAVAARLLAKGGGEDFSLVAVAREMDRHPVSLTYYFKRREDLVAAVLADTFERTRRLLDTAGSAATPHQRLRDVMRGGFDLRRSSLAENGPTLVPLGEIRLVDGAARRALDEELGEIHRRLAAMLMSPDTPSMTSERSETLARLVTSLMTWSDAWLWQYAPDDFQRVADRLTDIMVFGLAGRVTPGAEQATMIEAAAGDPPDTRERYLRAATKLINTDGFRGASVDRLSAELRLTKGSSYHHLPTKNQLLSDCFDRTFRLLAEARAASRAAGAGWESLSRFVAWLAEVQRNDDEGQQLMQPPALTAGPEQARRDHLTAYIQAVNGLADIIGQGVADASIRAVDPALASHYVLTVVFLFGTLRSAGPGAMSEMEEVYLRPALTGFFAH